MDWVSDNLFRVLLVTLLWSISMYFDSNQIETTGPVEQSSEVPVAVDAEVEDGDRALDMATGNEPLSGNKNYILPGDGEYCYSVAGLGGIASKN